jgi:hypothetical protein
MDQQNFETSVEQTILELTDIVEQYDMLDKESDIALFSKYDPLKNLISAVSAKLRSEQKSLGHDESLQKADEIVRSAEKEVNKTDVKKKICAALKDFTGDSLTLLSVLLELTKTGIISIPLDPNGVFLASAAFLVVARVGVSIFCTE